MKLDTKKIKKITDEELLELYKENLEKLKGMKCCICGEPFHELYGTHNPYPVRPECLDLWSKDGRCCSKCNNTYIASFRRIKFTEDGLYEEMAKILANCKTLDEIHDFAEANDITIYDYTPDPESTISIPENTEDPFKWISEHFHEFAKPAKIVPRPSKK